MKKKGGNSNLSIMDLLQSEKDEDPKEVTKSSVLISQELEDQLNFISKKLSKPLTNSTPKDDEASRRKKREEAKQKIIADKNNAIRESVSREESRPAAAQALRKSLDLEIQRLGNSKDTNAQLKVEKYTKLQVVLGKVECAEKITQDEFKLLEVSTFCTSFIKRYRKEIFIQDPEEKNTDDAQESSKCEEEKTNSAEKSPTLSLK